MPREKATVLEEFKNVTLTKFPKKLPLRRNVDHQIKLELKIKSTAMGAYCMEPSKLNRTTEAIRGAV